MSDKLFEIERNEKEWEKEWVGMPEFVQENHQAILRVVINFRTIDDIKQFNKITGLKIKMTTKGVFYPHIESTKTVYVKDEVPNLHNK